MQATEVFREEWDVDRRLAELRLNRGTLLAVRDIARASAANATPFHPSNASGTFAYQEGSWALRDQHVGEEWALDDSNGIAAIRHDDLRIRVVFSNVDIACNDTHGPKPRSQKGAGAERACMGNLFGDSLPQYAPKPGAAQIATYYLMVDEDGAAELTRPIVKNGTFSAYVERIYLSDGSDMGAGRFDIDDDDRLDDFDPEVARR